MRVGLMVMGLLLAACAHPRAQQPSLGQDGPPAREAPPAAVAGPVAPATAKAAPAPAVDESPAARDAVAPSTVDASPAPETPASLSAPAAIAVIPPVDFARDLRPILESRCQPCHFAGGRMYDRLPFDDPETIHTLGERLFTRIKSEKEQAAIRRFLGQRP
jgi:hypothetical protein